MAWNAAWKGELPEELPQTGLVAADVRIDLTVAALEIGVAHQRRAAMSGPGNVDHVQIELFDDPVQVYIDEILSRAGAPVPEQHALDVRELQWLAQQRIVVKIDLSDRQVVRGAPIRIHLSQQRGVDRRASS